MSLVLSKKARLALAIVLGAGALGAWQVGCSSNGEARSAGGAPAGSRADVGAAGADATGTIGLALVLPGGDQITSVSYQLTNGAGTLVPLTTASNPGTVATNNSQSIDFQLGGVPAGSGDKITLTATTTQGATCQGSATGITIAPRAATNVTIQLLCTSPGAEAGNLAVMGSASSCGTWTALSSGATGSEAFVGQTVTLTVTAAGAFPNTLGYTWTQSSDAGAIGVFGSTSSEAVGPSDTNTYQCTAPGTATVAVTVDDGPLPDGGGCPSSLSTVTTTVICDPNPANQGG